MLSEKSRPVIEATLPVIQGRINTITPIFYERLFKNHPELMDGMFSRADQKEGIQPRALAGSIPVFASYILNNPDSYPDEILSRVAHKHASLGVGEEGYEIVYKYLFEAIAIDLADALTPEIAEAWTEVYWLMAQALIKIEKGLYDSQANDVVNAPFTLVKKEEVAPNVYDFTFEPADNTPLTPTEAGQYVGVVVKTADGLRQPRQYSLLPSQPNQRRFAVKINPAGEVTPMLKDLREGDTIELSNPYGDVVLSSISPLEFGPLYLFTSGIGIAPALAFVHKLASQGNGREIIAVHRDQSLESWPLRQEYAAAINSLPDGKLISFLQAEGEGDYDGDIDMSRFQLSRQSSAFMCGPLNFMQTVRSSLVQAGLPGKNIHYEVFGPDQWMHRARRQTIQGRRYVS